MKYELSPIESIEVVNDRFDYVYDIEMDDTTDHVFFGIVPTSLDAVWIEI